jgi:hypothetical protein
VAEVEEAAEEYFLYWQAVAVGVRKESEEAA